MTFAELLEKHKKEDGTYDFEKAQAEYDALKNQEFDEEKTKILGSKETILSEKKDLQKKLEEIEANQQKSKLDNAKNNEDYKTLYESEKQRADGLDEKFKTTTSKYKNSILDSTISSKLQEAGVQPHVVRLLKNDFLSKADIIEQEDGSFKKVAKVGNDNLDIDDYIKTTLQSDEYKPFLSAPQNSGGGASGSGKTVNQNENPFSKETWNVDKQQELYLKDQGLAEKMKEQAE